MGAVAVFSIASGNLLPSLLAPGPARSSVDPDTALTFFLLSCFLGSEGFSPFNAGSFIEEDPFTGFTGFDG